MRGGDPFVPALEVAGGLRHDQLRVVPSYVLEKALRSGAAKDRHGYAATADEHLAAALDVLEPFRLAASH